MEGTPPAGPEKGPAGQLVEKARLRRPFPPKHVSPAPAARPGKRARKPCYARLPNPPHMSLDSDFTRRAAALRTSQKDFLTAWPAGPEKGPAGFCRAGKKRNFFRARRRKKTAGTDCARRGLSKKPACGDLFRQNAFPPRFQRGRGNAQGNLAAQGLRIHRRCRRPQKSIEMKKTREILRDCNISAAARQKENGKRPSRERQESGFGAAAL